MSKEGFIAEYGSLDQIKDLINRSKDPFSKYSRLTMALQNPAANYEIVDMAWNHPNMRMTAAMHPKASKELLDKAVRFDNEDVNLSVLSNRNATNEHVEHLLTHKNGSTRQQALTLAFRNGMLKPHHIERAMKDPNPIVVAQAESIKAVQSRMGNIDVFKGKK